MKSDVCILNFLAGKFAAVILVHGLDGPIYATKMRELYKIGSDTFGERRDELINLGLLVEEKEENFPFRIFYKLTLKGQLIAEYLKEVHRIMEEGN